MRGTYAAPSHPAPCALAPCSMRLAMLWCMLLSAACIASTAWHGKTARIASTLGEGAWMPGVDEVHVRDLGQHPEKLQLQMASFAGSAR